MSDTFIIPLNGLKHGKSVFSWHAGKEFFRSFDNSDVIDADISINVEVEKSGSYLGVDCDLSGTMTVPCDRCLEDVTLPVDTMVRLSVKFGAMENRSDDVESEDDAREIISLPDAAGDFDMSQIIYDYSCLALPLQRTHKEGECNPDTVKYLAGEGAASGKEQKIGESIENNPFAVLKGLNFKK